MNNDGVAPRTDVEVMGDRRHRRFSVEEKLQILEEMLRPDVNISRLAREHGTSPSVLFRWRKRAREGSLDLIQHGWTIVSISQVRALEEQVRLLERLLGKKTAECEVLREALERGDCAPKTTSITERDPCSER
jgi:transposase